MIAPQFEQAVPVSSSNVGEELLLCPPPTALFNFREFAFLTFCRCSNASTKAAACAGMKVTPATILPQTTNFPAVVTGVMSGIDHKRRQKCENGLKITTFLYPAKDDEKRLTPKTNSS
jgi:hypothetical protein